MRTRRGHRLPRLRAFRRTRRGLEPADLDDTFEVSDVEDWMISQPAANGDSK